MLVPDAHRMGYVRAVGYLADGNSTEDLVVINSPTQARHVLAYVLGNWRKHREDRHGLPATWLIGTLDP